MMVKKKLMADEWCSVHHGGSNTVWTEHALIITKARRR